MIKVSKLNESTLWGKSFDRSNGNVVRKEDDHDVLNWLKDAKIEEIDFHLPSGNKWLSVNYGVMSGNPNEDGKYISCEILDVIEHLPDGYYVPNLADWQELIRNVKYFRIKNTKRTSKDDPHWSYEFNDGVSKLLIPKAGHISAAKPDFVVKAESMGKTYYMTTPIKDSSSDDKHMRVIVWDDYTRAMFNMTGLKLNDQKCDKVPLRLIKR